MNKIIFFLKLLISGILTALVFPVGIMLFFYFFTKELFKKNEPAKIEKKIIHYNVIDIKTKKILH